jgi:hypothetical protein
LTEVVNILTTKKGEIIMNGKASFEVCAPPIHPRDIEEEVNADVVVVGADIAGVTYPPASWGALQGREATPPQVTNGAAFLPPASWRVSRGLLMTAAISAVEASARTILLKKSTSYNYRSGHSRIPSQLLSIVDVLISH